MKLDQGCCFQATTDWSLDTFLTLSLLEKANLITSKRIRLTLTFLFGVCFVSVHEIKYYLLLLLVPSSRLPIIQKYNLPPNPMNKLEYSY